MKTLFRWTILTLTVGGGFTGFVLTAEMMVRRNAGSPAVIIFGSGFSLLYLLTILSGLRFSESPKNRVLLTLCLLLQVPLLSSPLLSYEFNCGLSLTVGFVHDHLSAGWQMGSSWQFSILKNRPFGLGLNLAPLAVIILLWTIGNRMVSNTHSANPTYGQPDPSELP